MWEWPQSRAKINAMEDESTQTHRRWITILDHGMRDAFCRRHNCTRLIMWLNLGNQWLEHCRYLTWCRKDCHLIVSRVLWLLIKSYFGYHLGTKWTMRYTIERQCLHTVAIPWRFTKENIDGARSMMQSFEYRSVDKNFRPIYGIRYSRSIVSKELEYRLNGDGQKGAN